MENSKHRISRISHCLLTALFLLAIAQQAHAQQAWIRINQLGYTTQGLKNAVWASKGAERVRTFTLVKDPRRTDKFYHKLPLLLDEMKAKKYSFERIDELLQ